jgi:hypothetical protein
MQEVCLLKAMGALTIRFLVTLNLGLLNNSNNEDQEISPISTFSLS